MIIVNPFFSISALCSSSDRIFSFVKVRAYTIFDLKPCGFWSLGTNSIVSGRLLESEQVDVVVLGVINLLGALVLFWLRGFGVLVNFIGVALDFVVSSFSIDESTNFLFLEQESKLIFTVFSLGFLKTS